MCGTARPGGDHAGGGEIEGIIDATSTGAEGKEGGARGTSATWTGAEQQYHQDAKEGDLEKVSAHLAAGIAVDACSPNGETALMQASYWGHVGVMRELIEARADANHVGWKEGATALMRASKSSKEAAVRLLIRAGADVTLQNHAGQRAFDMAGAFDAKATMPIKLLLTGELRRWVAAHLESACRLPKKATRIVLLYHCPDFGDEQSREREAKRRKDAENEHKTDDKDDTAADARRQQHEAQLRREYGSQRRQIQWSSSRGQGAWGGGFY